MTEQIVVIGAGHAGVELVDALRSEGFAGDVVLVGDEHHLPYHRPPLTKDFLHDPDSAEMLPLRGKDFYASNDIRLVQGSRVDRIDREFSKVILGDGTTLAYDQLVLATGARAREHPFVGRETSSSVHLVRGADDANRFGQALGSASSVVVIGAGYIGLEVAAAARARGVHVTVITTRPPLARVASAPLSAFLLDAHRALGTCFVFDEVVSITGDPGGGAAVDCVAAGRIHSDLVLVAIGSVANAELAEKAGLPVSGGVVVDEYFRTSDERIWAIGDVAARQTPHAGIVKEESVQAASHQAQCLARTLTGDPTFCTDVPWFWSTQHKIRLQIAGLPDPTAQPVIRGDVATGRFSVFAYSSDRLVAVESVNSPGDHLAARRILASGRVLEPASVVDPAFDLKAFSHEGAAV